MAGDQETVAAAALNSAWLYQRRHVIRVAVALLLSRSQDLAGTTEEELHRTLRLPSAAENALTTTLAVPPHSPLSG